MGDRKRVILSSNLGKSKNGGQKEADSVLHIGQKQK